MNGPVDLLVYAFNEQGKADQVLKNLRQLDRQGVIDILNAAVLVRNEKGKARIKETEDVAAGRGALFGAVVGGLIGLLGGPVGAVLGMAAGAATGGASAHLIDMGFSNEHLEEIQDSLPPGSSAIVALIEHEWVERVIAELEEFEGTLFRQALKAEIAAQLAEARSAEETED
ncbi:MAG: DUF1269 domain-containing protein [Anaerolineae bacterium]|jgi:uncharacterized membrane protein